MILYCDFKGDPKLSKAECVDRFAHFYDPDFGNCYSFDSSQDDNGDYLKATESDVWQELSELILILNTEEDEYLESSRDPGFLITFHTARIYPDPFSDGFQLRPGFSYNFGLQKFTNELLTLPYKTNCTDYDKLPWKRRIEDRKLSTRMCTAECSQHEQLVQCDYVTNNIRLFFDDWSDKINDPEKEECAEKVSNLTMDYCRSLCRVPCKQTSFKVTSDSSAWPRKDKNLPLELNTWRKEKIEIITKNLVRVRIYFSTMEHTIYKNYPKYRPLELFSYLGGYVGIWLGISLVAFYEFLERLILILMFPLNKKRRKRKSSKVRHIMASQIHR
ncbi:amiloride-sensitive sodium channel subunit beta-2-like [Centruroides sculpturatus]|uniref:amiloride-sensitive sodium channel subunit beta-2-like n=1 Tax=Centruroides sculpturatus TaxID=218467 RepID=UPI000C6ED4B7|nr:amiloride-sensitive sodium channel subunit beta-2-like [Centruroides sculpturatus]